MPHESDPSPEAEASEECHEMSSESEFPYGSPLKNLFSSWRSDSYPEMQAKFVYGGVSPNISEKMKQRLSIRTNKRPVSFMSTASELSPYRRTPTTEVDTSHFDIGMRKSMDEYHKFTASSHNRGYPTDAKSHKLSLIRGCTKESSSDTEDCINTTTTDNESSLSQKDSTKSGRRPISRSEIWTSRRSLSPSKGRLNAIFKKFDIFKSEGTEEKGPAWTSFLENGMKLMNVAIPWNSDVGKDYCDDWEFWGKALGGGAQSCNKYKREIRNQIYKGIPNQIRGLVWRTVTNSSDIELRVDYRILPMKISRYESIIRRDIARTFPDIPEFSNVGTDTFSKLYNIVNAYSTYDPEIGYCQGISFIAGVLLLNMPEEDSFYTLLKLMTDYKLRDLYSQTMSGLNTKIYQFDMSMKFVLPELSKYFKNIGIESSMYVSEWFMTVFSYRFPMEISFVIMDILIIDGIDSMVKIAVALMKRNSEILMQTEFEDALRFMKGHILDVYNGNPKELVCDYVYLKLGFSRLEAYAKEYKEKRDSITSSGSVEELRKELDATRKAMEAIKLDLNFLNNEYMSLMSKHNIMLERFEYQCEHIKALESGGPKNESFKGLWEQICIQRDKIIKKNINLAQENDTLRDTNILLSKEIENLRKSTKLHDKEVQNSVIKGAK